MMAAAFVLGLLLSFTPCVLPMVPILLSIIAGQRADSDTGGSSAGRAHGLSMAAVYVLGVSVVYTLLRSEERRVGKVWRAGRRRGRYTDRGRDTRVACM